MGNGEYRKVNDEREEKERGYEDESHLYEITSYKTSYNTPTKYVSYICTVLYSTLLYPTTSLAHSLSLPFFLSSLKQINHITFPSRYIYHTYTLNPPDNEYVLAYVCTYTLS